MPTRHVAYGLELDASFELPAMDACGGHGLPSLALERVAPAALDEAWSGAQGPPEWSGRLGDGASLTIERGARGDVLFSYGEHARFRLDPRCERLQCAPLHEGLHWRQAPLGRILPNVAIMRGYEALHASAVDSPEGVVAIAAPSGAGKTTLALELLRRGWPLFADDTLVLGEGPEGVLAHPGSPHMNVADSSCGTDSAEALGLTLGRLAGERWIAVHNSASEPRPVRLICLLERAAQPASASQVLPSSPLPLTPYILGLAGELERERRRFTRYADLMQSASLMRLWRGSDDRPGDLADVIEQALAEQASVVVGSAR